MANDRFRDDRERERYRDESERGWRDRTDTQAGGRRYGLDDDRDRDDDGYIARRGFGNESAGYDRRYDAGRERDYGDSAGYGTGGSTRDWRDVLGEDRRRGGTSYVRSYDRDDDRSGHFGRGSRDYDEERGFFERAGDEIRSWFGDDDADRRREMDIRRGEHHRGRGPKGYQRSDERIREDVNDRLTDDPHIDASDIDVLVSNREVTLNGTVKNRFEKRHAEDLAESVSGVSHVQNNLRVQQHAGMGGEGTTSGMGDASSIPRRTTGSSNV
jgi:osmotically-inducible protein OsmY